MTDATTNTPEPDGRIYAIKANDTGKSRLVFAGNPAQALRHVAKDSFTISIPTTAEAIALSKAGAEVEIA